MLELELQQNAPEHHASKASATHHNITASLSRRTKTQTRGSKSLAVNAVRDKICSNYSTIRKHFHQHDVATGNTGKVDQSTILNVLEQSNVGMTPKQASEIIDLLDPDDGRKVFYKHFLAIFHVQTPRQGCSMEDEIGARFHHPTTAPPAPLTPVSRMPTAMPSAKSESGQPQTKTKVGLTAGKPAPQDRKDPNVRDRPTTQMRTALVFGGNLSANRISLMAQLYHFIQDFSFKINQLFDVSDMDSSNTVSKYETCRIFTAAGQPLTVEELEDVLDVLGEKAPAGYVNYKTLLAKLSQLTFDMPEIFESLTSVHFAPTHLYQVVGARVKSQYKQVLELLADEDTEGTGLISKVALLRIISGLGVAISLQSCNELLRTSGIKMENFVNMHHFIQRFVPSHRPPSASKHAALAERARVPREINNAPAMDSEVLLNTLRQKMEDNIKYPRVMFLQLDTDRDGTLTKAELAKAFLRFNLYPTSVQIDAFFQKVDVHKRGRLSYEDFLQQLVPKLDMQQPQDSRDASKLYMPRGSFYSQLPHGVAPIRVNTQQRMSPTSKLSLSDIQNVIRKKLKNQEQEFHALLKQRDEFNSGFVEKQMMLQALRKLDVFIVLSQLEELLDKQGIHSHGDCVQIKDVMAKLLLSNATITAQSVEVQARKPVGARLGAQTHRPSTQKSDGGREHLINRIRSRLRGRWEEVQKAFLSEQEQSPEFKVGRVEVARILANFGVPIVEDEGRSLIAALGDSIDYLDFARLLHGSSQQSTATSQRLPNGRITTRGAQVEVISPSRNASARAIGNT